jgi:signal transduction histidine kinase/CheY-like chemotaxis protein
MLITRLALVASLAAFFSLQIGFAATNLPEDNGIPIYTIYNLEELDVGLSTLKLFEDSIGRLLVYEDGNLFSFNGHRWANQMDNSNAFSSVIVSLVEASDGTIYAGAIGNWGKLSPMRDGNYVFESLDEGIDRSWASTNRFSYIVPEDEGAIFVGETAIVRYNKTEGNKVWSWLNGPSDVFRHDGITYIATQTDGVFTPVNEELKPIEKLQKFVNQQAIFHHVVLPNGDLIFCTRSKGLYRFDGTTVFPIHTQIDDLIENGLTDIELIEDDYFALAIIGQGIFFLNRQFELLASIDKDLDANFVSTTDLFYQDGGILWASIPNGIAKIVFPSPITLIDERMGPALMWPKLSRYQNTLYISTNGNFYQANYMDNNNLKNFTPLEIPGAPIVRCAIMTDAGIVFCKDDDIFLYHPGEKTVTKIVSGVTGNMIKAIKNRPGHLIVLGADYHQMLKLDNNQCIPVGEKKISSGYSCVSMESADGDIWVEHGINRVARVVVSDDGIEVDPISCVDYLPEGWINIWEYEGTTYLTSCGKIVAFDPERKTFIPDQKPDWLKGEMIHEIVRPIEDKNGDIWITSGGKIFIMRKNGTHFVRDDDTLGVIKENQQELFLEADGSAFIYSKNRIFRYNPKVKKPASRLLEPKIDIIRTVRDNRVVYSAIDPKHSLAPLLPYGDNGLVFTFFSPAYSFSRLTRFSYRLEGLSQEWSDPTTETSVTFNNLFEGNYTFRVRTVDMNGLPVSENSYAFAVAPPIYRRNLAYVLYFISSIILLILIIKRIVRKSEKERHRLEHLVRKRTHELDTTNQQLKLALVNAENAKNAKGRFLANMSHEIRTPMSGVVGMTDILMDTPLSREQMEIVNIIKKSGSILLNVINDILDYSRIEAGKIDLKRVSFSLSSIVESVLDILGKFAYEKNIAFFASINPKVPSELIGDSNRISQILVNLANNAIKFTHEGEVEIRVDSTPHGENQTLLKIAVVDTGIGISNEKKDLLFQSFSQVDPSDNRIYGGSGLGLAICKRLVELMDGKIWVQSEENSGSEFIFEIPITVSDLSVPLVSSKLKNKSLIYVDACSNRQKSLLNFLEAKGVITHGASNIDECILLLNQHTEIDYLLFETNPSPDDWKLIQNWLDKADPEQKPDILVYRQPLEDLSPDPVRESIGKPVKQFATVEVLENLIEMDQNPSTPSSKQTRRIRKKHQLLEILLVEDNPVSQQVCELMLRKLDFSCDLANDGHEAIKMLETGRYDLILMDIQMPNLNGLETTKIIRSAKNISPQPRIVALTAGIMENDYAEAFSAGMDEFIPKPVVFDKLKEIVEKTIHYKKTAESPDTVK